jgi:hypothetical protein
MDGISNPAFDRSETSVSSQGHFCWYITWYRHIAIAFASIDSRRLKWLYHEEDNHFLIFCVFSGDCCSNISQKYRKNVGAFPLERRESKPKAWVRMNKDIEMNPKADDSHPSTNEA